MTEVAQVCRNYSTTVTGSVALWYSRDWSSNCWCGGCWWAGVWRWKRQQGAVGRLGAGGWTKQCCTEEGARKGEKGRGPRPRKGPTVGVHAQRRVTRRLLYPFPSPAPCASGVPGWPAGRSIGGASWDDLLLYFSCSCVCQSQLLVPKRLRIQTIRAEPAADTLGVQTGPDMGSIAPEATAATRTDGWGRELRCTAFVGSL